MAEILILFVAVLVFCLLWIGVDQIAALLPKSANPPLPLAVIGHILLILAAAYWLVTRYL